MHYLKDVGMIVSISSYVITSNTKLMPMKFNIWGPTLKFRQV